MLTHTIEPISIDDIQTALSKWFGDGPRGEEPSWTVSRKANNLEINVFIRRSDNDFKVKFSEHFLFFQVKTTKLNLNLGRFLVSSAFEGERLRLKINEDPARNNHLMMAVFRQLSESKHPAFCTRILRAVAGLEDDLTTALIEAATAAPTDQLVMLEALSSAPWVSELTANDPILEARLRGLEVRQEMLQQSGGILTSEKVAKVLQISRQAVDKRRAANQLLALTQGKRGYSYPSFQFEDGKTLSGLEPVLAKLRTLDPWMQLRFFTTPHERLSGKAPIDVLRKGQVENVVSVASGYGEQGAI